MLMGEVGNIHRAYRQSGGELKAQITSFCRFFVICCVSPIGRVRIAGPTVLAHHKGNERIGKARTTIHSVSPIVIEITY
jgi:hypothetical protein